MAYRSWISFAEDGADAPQRTPSQMDVSAATPCAEASLFSPLEWRIVHLARNDGIRSLREPGRWARLNRLIFGERSDPRLADGRLEALRRIAVEAWHRGYALHPARIAAFLSAGFTYTQLERLLADIAATRGTPKIRSFA